MTSNEAKLSLLKYYMYKRDYVYAATEVMVPIGCFADILTYDRKLFATEIEIKVTKADFMLEIKSVNKARDTNNLIVSRQKKCLKHFIYLREAKDYLRRYNLVSVILPSKFYFAVPEELIDFAKEYVKSPYGLISLPNDYYCDPKVVKRGQYLHKEPLTTDNVIKLSRKACTENINLRNKL